MTNRHLTFSVLSLLFAVAYGCSSSESTTNEQLDAGTVTDAVAMGDQTVDQGITAPTLDIDPESFQIPLLGEGQRAIREVTLTNGGETEILIDQFELNIDDGTAALVYGSRRIIGIDVTGTDTFPYPVRIAAGESLPLYVEYTLGAGIPGGSVKLTGNFASETATIPILGIDSVGTIETDQAQVNFGRVRENTEATATLVIRNIGQATLNISDIQKDSNVYYRLSVNGDDPVETPSVYEDPDQDGSPGLEPGTEFEITIDFAPTRPGTQRSLIIIDSDDPLNPELRIPVIANESEGCINVSHETLEWSGDVQTRTESPTVSVTNCGEGPLYIDRIGLTAGSADAFEFQGMNLPTFPSELMAGAAPLTFSVIYAPPTARRYRGNVEILSNDPNNSNIMIPLIAVSACASDEDCQMGYFCENMVCIEAMME
ncbi:MAG: choice-of-anchor D domain-containing protein [Myxococcota bacterium]|nr:choice-of-anchor D domain-containing protein [Myxococcota bacterium]